MPASQAKELDNLSLFETLIHHWLSVVRISLLSCGNRHVGLGVFTVVWYMQWVITILPVLGWQGFKCQKINENINSLAIGRFLFNGNLTFWESFWELLPGSWSVQIYFKWKKMTVGLNLSDLCAFHGGRRIVFCYVREMFKRRSNLFHNSICKIIAKQKITK